VLKARLVDELQMRSAMARLDQWGGRLAAVLVDMGFVDEERLVETIGKALKMNVSHLGTVVKDPAALAKVDVTTCEENAVFPVSFKDRALSLAMADPTDLGTIDSISAKSGARIVPVLSSESEIAAAIARHYRGQHVEPKSYSMRKRVTHEVPATEGGNLPENVFQLDLRQPPRAGSVGARAPSANTMLDEFLDDDGGEFTEAEVARIEACRLNQDKAATILRAVQELLKEKGVLS
jgi:hypothetical protein